MQLEVGSVLEGKVSGITSFGVFVDLPEGKTGMVHISEVAQTYVKEIKDFVQMGQTVRVKVLSISPEGKVSLSIKQAVEQQQQRPRQTREQRRPGPGAGGVDSFEFKPRQNGDMSFEDMMNKFKKSSDEKMGDLKKVIDTRRGSQNRRSNQGH